jgi:hypothetical protein
MRTLMPGRRLARHRLPPARGLLFSALAVAASTVVATPAGGAGTPVASRTLRAVLVDASTGPDCTEGDLRNLLICGGYFIVNTPGHASNPTGTSPQRAPTSDPTAVATPNPVPVLETTATGGLCLAYTINAGATTPAEVAYVNQLAKNLLVAYAACPAIPAVNPAPLAVDPATLAEQFWQSIPLPVPTPAIPPGYAITGKAAYLVTGGTIAPAAYVEQTPLGKLVVRAQGTFDVDWGDGTTSSGITSVGAAYPHGSISHTYERVATVTVTLTERWTATWSLGAARGTLDELETQATLPNFAVRQVQAVITN